MTKDELLALLRLCNADTSAIEAVEMAYEMGYKAGLEKINEEQNDKSVLLAGNKDS